MSVKEYWGLFIGLVIGFALAKLYLIWAMLFKIEGLSMAHYTEWQGTPLWDVATANPAIFTLTIAIIFAFIGYGFVKTQIKIHK